MADGEILIKTKVDTTGAKQGLNDIKKETEETGSKAGSAFSKLGGVVKTGFSVAASAVAAGTAAITAFGVSSVKAGSEFDSAMSQVAATMGLTNEELNNTQVQTEEFTGTLRDFAQEMGSTTAFSATQAAEALNYMALAGYDAETSVETLPSVLNLAAAGGMELATASDMITDALSALGKDSEYAATMVDQMAVTSSKSNTSVSQLGEAILTVGATAADLAGGTVELNTALGILADNGTKGAEGGTRLRNIILALGAPTDKAAAALGELGVSAYDAEGNMRPLQDTIGDLSAALEPMTQEEKTNIINTIFNKADLGDVNYLLGVSAERWETLGADIEASAGAAEKMANTQLDNLAGDITLFQSALEGAKIAVSDGLTPTIREFVQFGSKGLSELTEAFKTDGIEGAMNKLGELLSEGLKKITDKLPQMVKAGSQLISSLIKGLTSNPQTLVQSVVSIVKEITKAITDNLNLLLSAAIQIIVELGKYLGQEFPKMIPDLVDLVLSLVDTLIDNVDLLIDAAIALIIGLADGLIDSLPKLIEKGPVIVQKLVEALVENTPKLLAAALELIIALADGLITNLPQLVLRIPIIIKAIGDGILDGVSDIKEAGVELIEGLWEGILERWEKLKESVKNLGKNLAETVKGIFGFGSSDSENSNSSSSSSYGASSANSVYNSVGRTYKAAANTQAAMASSYSSPTVDTSGIGQQVANAINGMAVQIDGRTAGQLLAGPVNNALGAIQGRRV